MTLFLLSLAMTVSGLFFTYVAVGLARSNERRRSFDECQERIAAIRGRA